MTYILEQPIDRASGSLESLCCRIFKNLVLRGKKSLENPGFRWGQFLMASLICQVMRQEEQSKLWNKYRPDTGAATRQIFWTLPSTQVVADVGVYCVLGGCLINANGGKSGQCKCRWFEKQTGCQRKIYWQLGAVEHFRNLVVWLKMANESQPEFTVIFETRLSSKVFHIR